MKRTTALALFVVGLLDVAGLAACDEDKKKADLVAMTKSSADAALPTAPEAASAGSPSAAGAEAAKPKEVVCPTGPDLTITDPDLEAELRLKLQKKPEDKLKASDLPNVRSLNLTKKASLDELDPCIIPKLVNLKHLYLGPGKLRDLRPIAGLVQLESLRASINEVSDLKPLEKLVLLDRVDLGRTHVRDLAPLANLVNMTELQLDDTEVSDIAPLAKCKKLEKLSVKHTNVTDVSPLKDMQKMKFLYVEGCAISNLDILSPLRGHGLRVVTGS